jgi:hypothetical protein
MATFGAVLDTCVLYPMPLADTLLLAASTNLFTFHWTEDLLDELQRIMLRNGRSAEEATRRTAQMRRIFAESEITGHQGLVTALALPDPDDRHVLAAAIRAGVGLIVTYNLSDFPDAVLSEYDIRAAHPDVFLRDLVDRFPQPIVSLLRRQAGSLKRRPMTFEDLLDRLDKKNGVPRFVTQVRQLVLRAAQDAADAPQD